MEIDVEATKEYARSKTLVASAERTPADYAIEFGGYLATAAQGFLGACNSVALTEEGTPENDAAREACADHRKGLESAIYEFRKRADRAKRSALSAREQPMPDERLRTQVKLLRGWASSQSIEAADTIEALACICALRHREKPMTKTIKACCGDQCKFSTSFRSPVARVVLCGREVTPEEIDRAKEAYCLALASSEDDLKKKLKPYEDGEKALKKLLDGDNQP